jgi:chromosome segregation ATPase
MKTSKSKTIDPNLFHTLMQFHREVALPDMERLIENQTKIMDRRFDHVYTLFDGVFSKFERLESELVALKGGLIRVEARLTAVEDRLTKVEDRLTAVESRVTAVESRLTKVEDRLESVESRLDSVESELQFVKNELGRFERWRSDVEARFDVSEQNAARDAKIAEINEQLTVLNGRVAALETRH